jgi:hypothetical protein
MTKWATVLVAAFCTTPVTASSIAVTVLATSGQPAPGTSVGVSYSEFSRPVINGSGQVAFRATLSGSGVTSSNNTGLWVSGGGVTSLLTRTGESVSSASGPIAVIGLQEPWLHDDGRITTGYGYTVGSHGFNGIATFTRGAPTSAAVVFNEHGFAPPLPPGFTPRWGGSSWRMASEGRVVLNGSYVESASSNDAAVWAGQAGSTAMVAKTGVALPGAAPLVPTALGPGRINASGSVAFTARSNTIVNVGGTPQNDAGVWLSQNNQVVPVLRVGDQAPDLPVGVKFSGDIATPVALNSAGWLGIRATYRGLPSQLGPTDGTAIWYGAPGNMRIALRDFLPIPGTAVKAVLGLTGTPDLADSGDMAIPCETENASGDRQRSLVRVTAGGQPSLVARTGAPIPGMASNLVYGQVFYPLMSRSGRLAFIADVGLNGTINILGPALMALDDAGHVQKIASVGDTILVGPGDTRTISTLFGWEQGGDPDDGLFSYSSKGDLAFRAVFTDGSMSVVVVHIPAPPAGIFLLTLTLGLGRRSRRPIQSL